MVDNIILKTQNLKKYFQTIKAVDGVDLVLKTGQTLGIVGETGCGKTTLAKLLVMLYKPTEGSVYFNGEDIFNAPKQKYIRKNIQMVFQDPYNTLDPRLKIEDTLKEGVLVHNIVEKSEITKEMHRLLNMVELSKSVLQKYPHEFSGGERQRIAIARALSTRPKLTICDEPVSSLDVSIRGKILKLLINLQKEFNLSYIFISHDISIVKQISDHVAVMHNGKIVEQGPALQVCDNPQQSYTKELMLAANY